MGGTILGIELGSRLLMHLEHIGLAESVVRKIYIIFLAVIGTFIMADYIRHIKEARDRSETRNSALPNKDTLAQKLQMVRIPPMVHFNTSGLTCSLWLPVAVGFITGIMASVLGIGGGFIRMPALIYFVGCKTAIAVGTDLFEVMITGAYGGFTYGIKGRVDIIAAMWMLLGAAVGAQMGTIAVKYVHGYSIRLLFAVTIYLACISVSMKQLQMQLLSSITIIFAGCAVSIVIMILLVRGIIVERKLAVESGGHS